MNLPELCKDCGGMCCTSPWLSTEEYIDLVKRLGEPTVLAYKPVPALNGWGFEAGCPALTKTGCIYSYEERPKNCRTYPFILYKDMKQGYGLLLSIRTCPHWKEFGEHYDEQMEEIFK